MTFNLPPSYRVFTFEDIKSFLTQASKYIKEDPYGNTFLQIRLDRMQTFVMDSTDGAFSLSLDDGTRFEVSKPLDPNEDYVFVEMLDGNGEGYYGVFYGWIDLFMNKDWIVIKFHEKGNLDEVF